MNQDEKDYVNWMNSLLRPRGNLAEGLEELARLKEENAQLRVLSELTVQDINLLLSWVDTIDLEFGNLSQEDIALQTKLEIIREKMTPPC